MAGEWITIDVCLPTKPEFLEIQESTGASAEQVYGRLGMFWAWASLNCADGLVRGSPATLARVCGGDDQFWRAVEAVGWVSFDDAARTITVPGWEHRFSKSAKSRILDARRKSEKREIPEENDNVRSLSGCDRTKTGQRPDKNRTATGLERGEREITERGERRETRAADASAAPPPPPNASHPEGWLQLVELWNCNNPRQRFAGSPTQNAIDRLSEDGWLDRARQAISRLPKLKYFREPVTFAQLVYPGFVDRVLAGQYDSRRSEPGSERREAQSFSGDDLARFEATRRAVAQKMKSDS